MNNCVLHEPRIHRVAKRMKRFCVPDADQITGTPKIQLAFRYAWHSSNTSKAPTNRRKRIELYIREQNVSAREVPPLKNPSTLSSSRIRLAEYCKHDARNETLDTSSSAVGDQDFGEGRPPYDHLCGLY